MRDRWDISFATSGAKALELMEQDGAFDVVCSDMMMPGMTGDQLLAHVMERYPETVRLVLSGQLATHAIVNAGGIAHQIIGKPSDPDLLRARISRALALDHHITECNVKPELFKMCGIPSVSNVYWDLHNEINLSNASSPRVASIIEKDPGMATKLLQLAHAAHGGTKRITSISEAVDLIGVESIRSLALMPGIFEQATDIEMPEGFTIERLWEHALKVASFARHIVACDTDNPAIMDEAYTAGLLHDIGFLIISTKMPTRFQSVLDLRAANGASLLEAEKKKSLAPPTPTWADSSLTFGAYPTTS